MSNVYNKAMNNRGFIDRLTEKLPGYRGYIDRDARQEADRVHREFMANRLFEQKKAVRKAVNEITSEGGDIMVLPKLEKINSRLDSIAMSFKTASYGSAQFFNASAAGEEELQRLHEFDLSLVDCADEVEKVLKDLPRVATDVDALKAKLKAINETLDRVEEHFAKRVDIIKKG